MTLLEVKEFLRLESDYIEEDTFLQSLLDTAKEYIKNATGITYDGTNKLYDLAIKILVGHWYENREAISGRKTEKVDFSLNSILTQLQYCYIEDDV